MEYIEQGNLKISRGDKLVTIYKAALPSEKNEDLWSFVDALLMKNYEIKTVNFSQGHFLVILVKN